MYNSIIKETAKKHDFLKGDVRKEYEKMIHSVGFENIPKTIKTFLEGNGFQVVKFGDNGNNAYAITSCGIYLSSNGYVTIII
jgi:poly-D-alanine transfer protein DltD